MALSVITLSTAARPATATTPQLTVITAAAAAVISYRPPTLHLPLRSRRRRLAITLTIITAALGVTPAAAGPLRSLCLHFPHSFTLLLLRFRLLLLRSNSSHSRNNRLTCQPHLAVLLAATTLAEVDILAARSHLLCPLFPVGLRNHPLRRSQLQHLPWQCPRRDAQFAKRWSFRWKWRIWCLWISRSN